MVDEDKIDSLVKSAVLAELDGVEFIQDFDYATLCREYNGIGPEWAGETVRGKLTERLALFEPAALIHDMRNYRSDGTRFGFNYANMEFRENCIKLAKYKYGFLNWRRYCAWLAAQAMFGFVSGLDGWEAWKKASGNSAQDIKEEL